MKKEPTLTTAAAEKKGLNRVGEVHHGRFLSHRTVGFLSACRVLWRVDWLDDSYTVMLI